MSTEERLVIVVDAETLTITERPMTETEIAEWPNLPALSVPLPEP